MEVCHNPKHRVNQRSKILELLIAARGAWVPSIELAQISLQYSARVAELREHHVIENKLERQADGLYRYQFASEERLSRLSAGGGCFSGEAGGSGC